MLVSLSGDAVTSNLRQSLRSVYNFKQYINIIEAVKLQLEIYIAVLQLINVY
jgi:hypothetical protein